ncbi:hypothetical protein PG985_012003 [Apiospora marii]|uniref:uncharacterized protein n=1 Tax=Apiospora marii TaxID=335849 RepID=UPI00312D5C7E
MPSSPSSAMSSSGREAYETTQHRDPAPVFQDHGPAANLVLTASSVYSRSQLSGSMTSDSFFSSALAAKDPVYDLPFVKRCGDIDGQLHFRLILNVDRKLEEDQIRESFVPLPDDMIKDPELARGTSGGNRRSAGSEANTDGTSDSGYGSTGVGPAAPAAEIPRPHAAAPERPGVGLVGDERSKDDHECPTDHPSAPEQFSNKFFEIRKSDLAGYGAFARKDLKLGQKILVEPELFHADSVTLYDEYDLLSDGSRKAFKRMAAHCPTAGFDEVTSIFRTNSFNVGAGQAGIFLVAARFNHACNPRNNVSYKFDNKHDGGKRRITFTMTRDVPAGTELTITYGSCREELYCQWGFVCQCGGCVPLSDEDVARLVPGKGTNWN